MVFESVVKPEIKRLYNRLDEIQIYIDDNELLYDVLAAAIELISNAAKHSKGKEIELKVDVDESGIEVAVCDFGYGFDPPAVLSKTAAKARLAEIPIDQFDGRGLLTCMAAADELIFDENTVTVRFKWRTPF